MLLGIAVVFIAGQLHHQVHTPRARLILGVREPFQFLLVEPFQFPVALCRSHQQRIALRLADRRITRQGTIFLAGIVKAARAIECVGVAASLFGRQRGDRAERDQLRLRDLPFIAQRKPQEDMAKALRCRLRLPGQLFGPRLRELKVGVIGDRLAEVRLQLRPSALCGSPSWMKRFASSTGMLGTKMLSGWRVAKPLSSNSAAGKLFDCRFAWAAR